MHHGVRYTASRPSVGVEVLNASTTAVHRASAGNGGGGIRNHAPDSWHAEASRTLVPQRRRQDAARAAACAAAPGTPRSSVARASSRRYRVQIATSGDAPVSSCVAGSSRASVSRSASRSSVPPSTASSSAPS